MDVAADTPHPPTAWPTSTRGVIPGWIASGIVHLVLLFLLALFLRPVAPRGSGTDEFRTVGIFTRGDSPESGSEMGTAEVTAGATEESPQSDVEAPTRSADSSTAALPVDDSPPIPIELPQVGQPKIGPRAAGTPSTSGGDARDLVRGAEGRGKGVGKPGTGEGRVAFFGQGQEGKRFVFVLDASGSMYEHGAIQVAKAELLASIAEIEDEQEFQIMFYNDQILPMPTAGQRNSMFRGSEANRNLAAQHIRSVQPAGGTEHKRALLEALKLRPDVIFFLTDAGEPWVDAGDLAEIRKRNSGRARICVVEFGKGNNLTSPDAYWTKRLARENGGTYAYQDTQKFTRKR